MTVWTDLDQFASASLKAVVAVGTFDGVHVGHHALITAAVDRARLLGCASAVLTFDRHPLEVVDPSRAPSALTTHVEQERLIAGLGAEHLVRAPFTNEIRKMPAPDFIDGILVGQLQACAVAVGDDFRFGYCQSGDTHLLRVTGTRLGFDVIVVPPYLVDGAKASSSAVRSMLTEGDVAGASRVLGRPYRLSGIVEHGEKLGRRIGYPTANISPQQRVAVPSDGIYGAWAVTPLGRHAGACSIGDRPTVNGSARVIEVYLLDFSGDLYGARVDVDFVTRLREQRRFASLDRLREQIELDVAAVRRLATPGG